MSTIYRLIMDSRETGLLRRKCVARRQLAPWQARELNKAFISVKLTDRYIKERTPTRP